MAIKTNKPSYNKGAKVTFGRRRKGKHAKRLNKHKSPKT